MYILLCTILYTGIRYEPRHLNVDRDRSTPRGYARYNNNSLTGIGMKMYIKTTSKQKEIENENKKHTVARRRRRRSSSSSSSSNSSIVGR